jgi:hypothetical protein
MTIAVPQSRPAQDRRAWPVGWLVLPATLLLLLAAAASARADVGATIINRCTHGQSLSGFSPQDYRRALQELPAEVEEYSDCANLIRRAQLAAASGRGTGSGEAGAIPLTPSERGALTRVPRTGARPLQLGGQLISPGVVRASVSSALSSLPTPVLALLAFLLACALLLAGRSIRDRVRAYRSG